MVTKVTITLPSSEAKSYDAHIGGGAVDLLGEILSDATTSKRATIVGSADIWQLVGEAVAKSLASSGIAFDLIKIPDGEAFKTIETCQTVFKALTDFGARRGDAIVAVGGGVVGDLAGFVAASYMRGVPFINVPTTLLAQIDSSIGGKTGVDLPAGKNLVGAFYQPLAVISDIAFLATLPDREIRCGLAEIIKSAMLAGGEFLTFIENNIEKITRRDEAALAEAVINSVAFKAEVVSGDERDLTGRRAVLNYGHTFGHALEAASEYTEMNHGEAVAAGLIFAAYLGKKLGVGSENIIATTERLLAKAGFSPAAGLADVDENGLIAAMRLDKKKTGQEVSFVLLEGFGRPVIREVNESAILETIKEIYR